MTATLIQIAGLFALLSLLSVGGGNGVIPDMQRAAVSVHHWMSDQTFLDLFAISRASPGPGSLIVVLIGQQAAGLYGRGRRKPRHVHALLLARARGDADVEPGHRGDLARNR